jgi:hypothetical protein
VYVSGRRNYARFSFEPAGAAVLRVLRDVVVQEICGDELIVLDREPATIGDALTLELAELVDSPCLPVRVTESRPVVVDGVVRHRLRLQRTPSHSRSPETQ